MGNKRPSGSNVLLDLQLISMCVRACCQSINGVMVNGKRLPPGKWITLVLGDHVCFGVNTDTNELKYTLVQSKSEDYCLRRCGCIDEHQLSPPRKKARMSECRIDPTDLTQAVDFAPQLTQPQPDQSLCTTAALCWGVQQPPGVAHPVPLQSNPYVAATSSSSAGKANYGGPIEAQGVLLAQADPVPPEQALHSSSPVPLLNTTVTPQCEPNKSELGNTQQDEEKKELLMRIAALKEQLEMKEKAKVALQDKADELNHHENSMITSMEEEFTCCICQELFVRAHTLTCAHSFCELCIKEWMRTKMECPICRKKFSSQPVHSLALDNAITKIVDKLGPESKAAREALVSTHTKALCPDTSSTEKATTSGTTPTAASTRRRVSGTRDSPITIEADESTVIHIVGEESDDDDDDSDEDSDSDSEYEEGYRGAYYGGYGRCYNCGRPIVLLRISKRKHFPPPPFQPGKRGHWSNGCPERW